MAEFNWKELTERYGPHAILVGIFSFMVWIRTRPADSVLSPEAVYFSGNDPWYHSRMVRFTVEHFPATIRFDPWSRFPYGTGRHSGFGGLFDQVIALAAILVGGGDPQPLFINVVTAYAPVVFGAMTVVTVYLISRRLTGAWAGLIPAGLLALLGGQFLSRTVIGSADHQSAEAFFGSLAVLGFLYVIDIVYQEKPLVADVRDRNWFVLRRPGFAGLIGGVAIASYLMLWPPGVMLGFSFGIFVVLQSIRDFLDDRPLEYLVFASVLTFSITGLFLLMYAKSYDLQPTGFSLLQPLVFLVISVGSIILLIVSRYIEREDYARSNYPIALVVMIATALGLMAVVFPRGISLLEGLVSRVYSFGLLTSPSALTVAEIQPANLQAAWSAFGGLFYVAVIGGLIMLVRVFRGDRPLELLILLWSFTMFSAYFTSIRFGYYVAVNVAILSGFAIWWSGSHLLQLELGFDAIRDIKPFQVIGVLVILIAVIPGNVVAIQNKQPVWEMADQYGGTNMAWQNELEWVNDNTPDIPLDYTGRFSQPEDGDFDYPSGAYGVMSWWDYGHWITVTGERIPFANPFQEGPVEASAYLQAQNETRANLMLEAFSSIGETTNVPELSNAELRSAIASQSDQESGEDIRFVMIDDQMMGGKFAAIATWTGPGFNSYVSTSEFRLETTQQTAQLQGLNQRYHNTLMAKLYFGDASGLEHYRLVHETNSTTTFVSVAQRTRQGWQTTGIINRRLTRTIFEPVQQRQDLDFYDIQRASRVKSYERVEGAEIVGQVQTNNQTPVIASLRLQTNTGRNFTYIQQTETDSDGSFSMTVPYATDDTVSIEEAGSNSGVVAIGKYSIVAGSFIQPSATGNVTVPESAIYSGTTIPTELSQTQAGNNTTINVSG